MATEVRAYFRELGAQLFASLAGGEVLLLGYRGEESDFVRLNRSKVRQAGNVRQQTLFIDLIEGGREISGSLPLSGELRDDIERARRVLGRLRERLVFLPLDPYLGYATDVHDTLHRAKNRLPAAETALQQLLDAARDLDLVGSWAGGEMIRGFANSLGQFNWHSTRSFNLDWSIHTEEGHAVKQNYAGFRWDAGWLDSKLEQARASLDLLRRKPKQLRPGRYRVFLAPAALNELLQLLGWGGFGLKSHRTAQTPLLRMVRDATRLNGTVTITENHSDGLAPCFTGDGFIKPGRVELISNGEYRDCLVGRRSAMEFDQVVNCDSESPQSLQMAEGSLPEREVFQALGTGLYVSNLWYCNYSDRNHARITGMTRFACLWVERGRPVAPVEAMRFDESLYHIFGDRLEGLTCEREHLFDTGTYEWRSNASALLPGALIDAFTLTL